MRARQPSEPALPGHIGTYLPPSWAPSFRNGRSQPITCRMGLRARLFLSFRGVLEEGAPKGKVGPTKMTSARFRGDLKRALVNQCVGKRTSVIV